MSESSRPSRANAGPLLNTKLMPPRLHAAVIQRTDLLARLDEGLTKKLTLVTASTGFGKTTLVGMWTASRKFPSAWVTLDENDNDPARFWTYVITAIRTFNPALGKAQLSALMTSQLSPFESLLTPLLNDMADLNEHFVLVLDDYQTINSDEINQGLAFLVQHLPEALHLVLITRTHPDLPLAILQVRDEMIEIDAASLRFNPKETKEFLHQAFQTELPADAVDKLLEQTEGWAAGLRLMTLSLQNKGGAADIEKSIQSFSGSDRYVADYLIKEVFESQPKPMQTFLMKTCFLRRLTGPLCEAVTDTTDGAAVLERLQRDNLFIVQLDDSGNRAWYRYNTLFAESIQYLAKQRLDKASIKDMFDKASTWYETYGLYDEAIESALVVKSYDRVVILIKKYIEIHEISELRTLGRWLGLVPVELVLHDPEICLTYAQVILYSSDRYALTTAARIEPLLNAAEQTWHHEGNIAKAGEVSAMRGMVALWQLDLQKAFEYVHRSLEELPEYDIFWRGVSLLNAGYEALTSGKMPAAQSIILEAKALLGASRNIHGVLAANEILSEIFFWNGDMEQSAELNRQIMAEAVGGEEMLDDRGTAELNLAKCAYERNELETARGHAARALELATQRANESLQVEATIHLAYIHAAKNELALAFDLLKILTTKIKSSQLLREIQETQTRLTILRNDTAPSTGWPSVIASGMQNVMSLQKEREVFTLARLRIAEGKANEALAALQGWAGEAAAQGRVRSQVESLSIEALALHANTDLAHASEQISEALKIGQAKGFRRLILDEGPRMSVLLQAAIPLLPERTVSLYAKSLLQSFNPELGSHPIVEPLSQQEVRVLRLLAAGLSNTDIARELVVSTNTVKTHVKSIYRKLGINSREEARLMGRELNLL